jgi:hypothetical protein
MTIEYEEKFNYHEFFFAKAVIMNQSLAIFIKSSLFGVSFYSF